jgi:hypothetical protein
MTCSIQVYAKKNAMIGGAAIYETKDILSNAVNSRGKAKLKQNLQQPTLRYKGKIVYLIR